MKINSFFQHQNELHPVEVEISLWPGLPQLNVVGLPDTHVKESAQRIKSAIKAAGYEWPQAQQILVNLRPSHMKKTSQGLELAIALAYLWETEQIPRELQSASHYVYGELSLQGEVFEPADLKSQLLEPQISVLTGAGGDWAHPGKKCIRHLSHYGEIEVANEKTETPNPIRPRYYQDFEFSRTQAQWLELTGWGEHSSLLAGPAGSGKTTMAHAVVELMRDPAKEEFFQLRKVHRRFGEDISFRPFVKPHHRTPVMSMVGGGSVPFAGEISRAHGGVLLLDELLEFAPQVLDALREPFEEGRIRVARGGRVEIYPAQAIYLATTNLCPCGAYTPNSKPLSCRYSLRKCGSYRERLSGPLLDRFQVLYFSESTISKYRVRGEEILLKLDECRKFWAQYRPHTQKAPAQWGVQEALKELDHLAFAMPESLSSQRRKIALAKVARTLADLDCSLKIELKHLQEAMEWSVLPFDKLQRWDI